jgi:hypothetical protein
MSAACAPATAWRKAVYPEMSASRSVPRPAPECSSEVTSPSLPRRASTGRRPPPRTQSHRGRTCHHGAEVTQHGPAPARGGQPTVPSGRERLRRSGPARPLGPARPAERGEAAASLDRLPAPKQIDQDRHQGTAQAEAASHCPGCPLGTAQTAVNGTLVARPARKTMLTPGGDGFHVDVSVSPVAGGQLRRWQAAKAARQPWRRNPRSSQRVHQRSPAGRHAATGCTPSTRPAGAAKTPPWWTSFRRHWADNGSDLHAQVGPTAQ